MTNRIEPMLVCTDGKVVPVTPNNGLDFTLSELQKFVGGYIELMYLPEDKVLVVNEDGLFKGLSLNAFASGLVGRPIVGNVVYMQSEMVK